MIITNPVARLALKAISACGYSQGDSTAIRGNQVEQGDSPFVLVACTPDGRWEVYQQDFEKPRGLFDELQAACDYASGLARNRTGSMVLIRNRRDPVANPDSSMTQGAT